MSQPEWPLMPWACGGGSGILENRTFAAGSASGCTRIACSVGSAWAYPEYAREAVRSGMMNLLSDQLDVQLYHFPCHDMVGCVLKAIPFLQDVAVPACGCQDCSSSDSVKATVNCLFICVHVFVIADLCIFCLSVNFR